MDLLHEKSSCCKKKIIRFGVRRRQCIKCRRTWRVWQRARGRDRKRIRTSLLRKYLDGDFVSISKEADRRKIHESVLRRALNAALRKYIQEPWIIKISGEDSIVLLADAVVKRIRYSWWTIYFVAVKKPNVNSATVFKPVVLRGRESYADWQYVLNSLPENILNRASMLVCDGHRGLVYYARWSGWQVQRCQAHLLFSISGRRSQSRWSRHREEGRRIYQLVKTAITETDSKIIKKTLSAVEEMGWETDSRILQKIIRGFLQDVEDYRTYLRSPALNSPTTNNAMESFISRFQELCHRARGFATVEALTRWAVAFVKHRRKITCNGFHQPN